MRTFKFLVHTLLIATSPTLLADPQPLLCEQLAPETLNCAFSYDDVLHLLGEIENDRLQERCNEQELDRINQFLAHLATEGKLPTDSVEELESDIAQLLHISNSPYEYALSPSALMVSCMPILLPEVKSFSVAGDPRGGKKQKSSAKNIKKRFWSALQSSWVPLP